MIDIYRSGAVVASVHASDSDKVTKKVMGENTLSLSFTLAAPFNFKVGDYLYFAAEKYTLNITPEVVKRSTTMFDYTLLFEGIEYELRKVRLLFATEAMGIGGGADFSLMGNAALFAQVIVANLNRIQTGWTVGSVIESETKNLTFAGDSCLTAINKVATEFSTEYWIGQDKTVNIGKKGSILPVTFEYGLGNGLYSITRTNVSSKDIITRLYPFGSEQNLPKGYAGKRLQIDGDYIEANVDKYGVIESSQNFDDIKPERTGTITALGSDIFTFIDSSMDFDLNAKVDGNTLYLVPGTTAKIHFQSGDLAGYEFELSSYDHSTKAFKLIEFTNEIAYHLPNSTLKPAIGDTYIILDIYMPQTYVDAAKARLLAKAQESLAQNSEPQLSYKVAVDPLFVADKGLSFASCDYVGIKDTHLLIDRNIRLVSVTRNIIDPNKYEFDLADTVEPTLTTQILTTLEATDIIIKQNKLADPARARRNWKTVEELRGAIYDVDGYFDAENIKPFSIETNMLTVGSKGNQFYLDCYFQANYGGSANNLVVGDGSLSHFTIEENIRTWSVTGLTATIPDNNLRYIYVSCLKVGNTAQVTLSATTKAIEDETYYYFLAGVISSVIDSARQISLLFGFTSINGRFIKTGRIQSGDGNTYFDLDSGDIQGKITFKAGSSGYSQLTDKPDLSVFSERTYVDAIKNNLQSQIDGTITSWFFDYEPTLANVPATNWGDSSVMEIHLGDLFYWTSKGYAYRFQKVGSVFSWARIADTDVTLALANAAKAQDTADGKRRVFTSQPSAPYDAGDLWAKDNAIYKCNVPKLAGQAYAASDWSVTATDDTAAIAAQTAANAANAKISDMASDGKITPVEKKSLKQLIDSINAEFANLFDQAETYYNSDPINDARNDLSAFTTPLLADMTATSTVDRELMKQYFDNYNTAKIQLLSAINDAINGTATTALAQASAIFPSDANLVAHWSFDEVPEIPDGAYIYKSKQGWTSGVDGWEANGGALTIDSGLLKVTGANTSGIGMYRGWQASFENKSLIFKVKSKNKIQNAACYTNSGYSDALNPTIVDDYTWIVRFDNIQNNTYNALIIAVNHDLTNTEDGWIEWIYVGDGSYATTISDNSGNGRALINQGALAVSTGISGKSLSFNGASHAEVDSSDFRNPKFTISAWFKSPGMGVGQSIGGIVCITYMVRLELNANGTISFFGSGSNGGVISGQANLFGGWHHAAAVYTGTHIALYVDGSLIGLTQAVVSWDHGNPLYIGTDPNNSPWHFNGLIDEVRVYNRDLSGAEVLGLYKYVTKGKAFAVDTEAAYLKEALKNDTSIQGGLVSTTLLKVGAVNESGTYVERAGINGAGSGANTPRVYAGGTLAEAVARVAGTKTKPMAVITEGAKAFFDAGEIGGFDITATGIEKQQSITDSDGVAYTGKFLLDWVNQRINFIRDGASRVLISAKKLTTGIPTPSNSSVPAGAWQNEVDVSSVTSYNYPLATRVVLQPGGYDAVFTVSTRVVEPFAIPNSVNHVLVLYDVTVKIWITDGSNNKVSLLSSKSLSVSNTCSSSINVSFSVENTTGIAHEVEVLVNNQSVSLYTDPVTHDQEIHNLYCNSYVQQNTMSFTASLENVEIGYSGLRVLAQNLWFYFNTKDAEAKHFRMRGNAELKSKSDTITATLDDASFRASRLDLQGMFANLLIKSSSYTMVAADEAYAGIAVIGAAAAVTITLPDLNASKVVNGQTIYYNDRRVLFVCATSKQVVVSAVSGQTLRGIASETINYNTGFIYIGHKATGNWLGIGVG